MAVDFTPAPGFHVYRDAAGIQGLLLMTGAISEEFEQLCFETTGAIGSARQDNSGRDARTGEFSASAESFPPAMWAVINLVRDSGFAPLMSIPDYVLAWGYPPGSTFASHFDSRFQWGEAVMGTTFGAACEIRFTSEGEEAQLTQSHQAAA